MCQLAVSACSCVPSAKLPKTQSKLVKHLYIAMPITRTYMANIPCNKTLGSEEDIYALESRFGNMVCKIRYKIKRVQSSSQT